MEEWPEERDAADRELAAATETLTRALGDALAGALVRAMAEAVWRFHTQAGGGTPLPRDILQTCPKEEADKATTVRRRLKELYGTGQAAVLLGPYKEATLRVPGKGCQRFFVNERRETVRLTDAVGAQE